MKSFALKTQKLIRKNLKFIASIVLIFLVFITNPTNLRNEGFPPGAWIDPIDPFSEHLVRNTIKNEVFGDKNKGILLIVTQGYPKSDFNYFPYKSDGSGKYLSNLNLQRLVLSKFVSILNLQDEKSIDRFLKVVRLINGFVFALFLSLFLRRFAQESNWNNPLVLAGLTASNAGLILFSQNLYFFVSIFIAPLAFLTFAYGRISRKWLLLGIFLLAIISFFRGYEFATVYTFLCLLPILVFCREKPLKERVVTLALGFASIVLGFLIVAFMHVWIVYFDMAKAMGKTVQESISLAFISVSMRTMSLKDVPFPLSSAFVDLQLPRSLQPAFVIPPLKYIAVSIPKLTVLLMMVALAVVSVIQKKWYELSLILWGLTSYTSWYVFAYQHIMIHGLVYDWFIFAFSVGIAFTLLMHLYIAKLVKRQPRTS